MKKEEVKFWILWFLLNSFLFISSYLVNIDSSDFFPYKGFISGTFYDRVKYIFTRSNYDIFRISIDLVLISLLFFILRKNLSNRKYVPISFLYYFIVLVFLSYYSIFQRIYSLEPNLYNDIQLFNIGILNIGKNIFKNGLIIILVILFIILLYKIYKHYILSITLIKFGIFSRFIFVLFSFLFFINIYRSGTTYQPSHVFQESFILIGINLNESLTSRKRIKNTEIKSLNNKIEVSEIKINKKPNIFTIFIESYGKILYEIEQASDYFECLDDCFIKLKEQNISVVSNFSTAPVSGGKSWLSFSTVMSGIKIDNQGMFNYLFKDPDFHSYFHLYRFLKFNGYHNFRLNTMANVENNVQFEKFLSFYGADKWILFQELNYSGKMYGFGPSPPDQYSINFISEYLKGKEPYSLFFITQNSHNPFYAPEIEKDWKKLNDSSMRDIPPQVFLEKPEKPDYVRSICYELKIFTDFIVSYPDSNTIFILMGDHQPPIISGKDDGLETPVHIISKDKKFLDGFAEYGFREGLKLDEKGNSIRHEGFYSMFLREFVKIYGKKGTFVPDYYPYGIENDK